LFCRRPAGIDQQHVDLLAARFGERVEGEPGGVGPGRARDDGGAAATAQIFS